MRSHRFARVLKFALFAVLFVALVFAFGFVVKGLWNWLMPPLLGWKSIGYWQAMGLIILCKILFGGLHGSGGRGGYRRHCMREGWEQMTPEERGKFCQGLHGSQDQVAAPDSKPSA